MSYLPSSSQRQGGHGNRALFATLVLFLLLLALLAYADGWYANQLLLEQHAATRDEVRTRGEATAVVLNTHLSRLRGLAGFVPAAEEGEALWTDFESYAAGIHLGMQGIRYLAIAPDGVVQHLFAPNENRALLGHDLTQNPDSEVRAAVEQAMAGDEPVLAGPLTLPDGTLALIGTRAVYRDGAYWGLVQVALDLDTLLDDPNLRLDSAPLELALRDARGRVFLGSYTLFARDPVVSEIAVAEERWTLAGIPAGGWEAAIRDDLLLARVAGLLLATLLATIVYLTVDRQGRLRRAVAHRTRELAQAHELLEQRVEERTRELQTLLDVSRSVASTLDFSSLLSLLLGQLQQVVDFNGLAVYLVQEQSRLELAEVSGTSAWPQKQQPPAGFLELRAPLIVPDIHASTPIAQRWRQTLGKTPAGETLRGTSWMAVPLLLQNRILGVLVFEHAQAGYYTSRHAQLALALANHVAVAIENAHLYEQAHTLAALQERQKLARELHDSVSQALYGIGLGLNTALSVLPDEGTAVPVAELRRPLEYTLSLAKAALVEMRALIFELRPESLETEGLVPLLTHFVDALQARHQLEIQVTFEPEPDLPLATKEALYRVAQEALHNVVKHAGAGRVTVTLTTGTTEVMLEVQDDGAGFDPQNPFPGHLGLHSMRERVEGRGGSLTIQSAPGTGTLIRARIPHLA